MDLPTSLQFTSEGVEEAAADGRGVCARLPSGSEFLREMSEPSSEDMRTTLVSSGMKVGHAARLAFRLKASG